MTSPAQADSRAPDTMLDAPVLPGAIPPPDRTQIEPLNALYELAPPGLPPAGFRERLIWRARHILARLFFRQQQFNSAVVDHLNRNLLVAFEAHRVSLRMIEWLEERQTYVDQTLASHAVSAEDVARFRAATLARDRHNELTIGALIAAHQELKTAVGVLQHATQELKQEIRRVSAGAPAAAVAGADVQAPAPAPGPTTAAVAASATSIEGHTYVGFEDQFRGAQEDIRKRLTEYVPIFAGASDVLDAGCGRGEFLALLRQAGVGAKGVDVNPSMVEVCREKGLDATVGDALGYLRSVPDGSLGGLIAAQVVEHLEPRYLTALLETAFAKLRPGSPIVLETINPACWFAFFESYIRDITHVRPLHPETLQYLLVASGFQDVKINYQVPYPEHDKLQPVAAGAGPLGDWAETLNSNVEKINRLLFTYLDYAAIGRRA